MGFSFPVVNMQCSNGLTYTGTVYVSIRHLPLFRDANNIPDPDNLGQVITKRFVFAYAYFSVYPPTSPNKEINFDQKRYEYEITNSSFYDRNVLEFFYEQIQADLLVQYPGSVFTRDDIVV